MFHEDGYPASLSEWNLMSAANGVLTLSPGVNPYDLATPLFTDYALKLRTVTLPKGTAATYRDDDVFDFPVGTILSKTFYYPLAGDEWTGDVAVGPEPTVVKGAMPLKGVRLVETRLLVSSRRRLGRDPLCLERRPDRSAAPSDGRSKADDAASP